jgi:hypothetical protein
MGSWGAVSRLSLPPFVERMQLAPGLFLLFGCHLTAGMVLSR